MRNVEIYAGPKARAHLREYGLRPQDIRVVPAAAGGPKGLVLNPLDRYIFGRWLAQSDQVVHVVGASIGAWRMACACLPDPGAALAQLAEDYITQRYPHRPGKLPEAEVVSQIFGAKIVQRLGGALGQAVLSSPRYRLHVFTSHGRRLLHRPGRMRAAIGYLGAYLSNAASRRALGIWLERVVFSDPRDELPFPLADFRSQRVALNEGNLAPAILASCTIPFALQAVQDVPGAPPGTYWDGGITDYHLHLNYSAMSEGLVLYPHFQPRIVPGWLDKAWHKRHRASGHLDNLVVLSPHPGFVERLPNGKLPDRQDFRDLRDDDVGRERIWRVALAESTRLAEDFARVVERGGPIDAQPLP
ncbi:MAG: patatin-like phospholipase family protein [Rubrivivax sp.]|nr:patatin-like phospholipase family protein [Rubrivivax sp.]